MENIDRRNFIKFAGTALGGVLLTGCGVTTGGGSGSAGGPNGYRFYKLKSVGESVGLGSLPMTIHEFGGSVHISSGGVITFDAYDKDNRHGLFQIDVDLEGSSPVIDREHTSVLSGNTLGDQRVVRKIAAHDVDDRGRIAAILHPTYNGQSSHYGGGLYYLDERNTGFTPVMTHGDKLGDGATYANGIFGDIALCENNGILVVASQTAKIPGARSGQSLIHMPVPGALLTASNLMSTSDYIIRTDHQVSGIGIVDVSPSGHFAMSCHTVAPALLSATPDATTETGNHGMVSGHLSTPNDHSLFVAPPLITSSTHTGEISYGPRVGFDGTVHTKVGGIEGDHEMLVRGDEVIRRTSEPGPSGEMVASFTPGATGSDGSYYYTQYAEGPDDRVDISLLTYDGSEHRTILTTGDVLTDGGAQVANIVFATTTNHVDGDNRIVMLCQFTDGSTSLVVGIPV